MERELMTVKAFAEYLGISPQAIYKRLNNPNNELNDFVQSEFNGQKLIDKRAEVLFKPRSNNVEQPTRAEALDVLRAELEAYRDQLKVKDDQLKAKDNQIAEMQQTINTLSAAVTSALNQQQALNAAAAVIQKQLIDGAAEASKDTGAGTSSTGTATATPSADGTPSAGAADNKQRRGLFGALDTIRAKFKR
jgi:chromosome segregation ATPase